MQKRITEPFSPYDQTMEKRSTGTWNPVIVKRLAVAQAPLLYPRNYVPLRSGGKNLEPVPVSEQGNYVVLLYDDEAGQLQTVNFRDFKFLSAD